MKSWHITLLFVIISIAFSDVDYNGTFETYHAIGVKRDGQFNSSRIKYRAELYSSLDNANLFSSVNAEKNLVVDELYGVRLHEAYLEYIAYSWDIRVGRQIISWGNSDGVKITDIISPNDYTEFITRDFDDIRIPVDMIKFRYFHDFADLELIIMPYFEPNIMPDEGNVWSMNTGQSAGITLTAPELPEKRIDNSEFAVKMSKYFSGMDLSMSYINTWSDNAYMQSDSSIIRQKFYRNSVLGLELSLTKGEFVLRSELGFMPNYHVQNFNSDFDISKKDILHGVLGIDWYACNNYNLSVQAIDRHIFDFNKSLCEDENSFQLSLNQSVKLFRETLTISDMLYLEPESMELYNRISAEYLLNDAFSAGIGADIFSGDDGIYGCYSENSQIWIKAVYSS